MLNLQRSQVYSYVEAMLDIIIDKIVKWIEYNTIEDMCNSIEMWWDIW